ncbi:DUF3160 domain-containing protein [Anaerosphaera multitolerans]|uniref:DUF3160 domain-containing protein n=1 Tax=Anaerosphaera multitolerans TaxID=2487351 RepID=A0A437S8Y3_9FIRM|nr:DUF3160 domain-containing protein [Anaerosphaera multitolerans]RVU55570.1 DUF3160 domain-containing protein [Anaerosphaera multitolerans]
MKKVYLLLSLILVSLLLISCNKKEIEKNEEPISTEELAFLEEYTEVVDIPYNPKSVEPKVPEYEVNKDLSNVENLASFGNFTASQKEALSNYGFFIAPIGDTNPELGENELKEQIFRIYEDNEYKNLPSFITSDSIMHMYHLFYDNFLKRLEESTLLPKLESLTAQMLEDSLYQYNSLSDKEVKELSLRNVAYFATAMKILDKSLPVIPPEAEKMALEEYNKIMKANGISSDILNTEIDYSQFTPRGHYTKSDSLKKYFKTVMYYGQAGFFVEDEKGVRDDLIGMALLMTDTVYKSKENYELWSDVYEPVNFLVESADDLGIKEYGVLLYGVYGKTPDLNTILDSEKIQRVYGNLEMFPKPSIADSKGYSYRFMPQRAVLDSALMQRLIEVTTETQASRRPIYSGLDIMATFGDDTAIKMQWEDPYNKIWPSYEEKLKENQAIVANMKDEDWKSNLYRGWLWTLKEYAREFGKGYPMFMQNEAWEKKDLNSALGSWAELKHDTVLYGKQTMAEMGGGYVEEIPKSYVEPNIAIYEKLSWLVEYTIENLEAREMLDETTKNYLSDFKVYIIDPLIAISEKELNNEALTEEENSMLHYIGGAMEGISLRFVNDQSTYWDLLDETDRSMAIVSDLMKVPQNEADVPPNTFLSVGVGPAYEIYVVYPIDGKLYLGRGGIFSYREFLSDERLTDEKWQLQVKEEPEKGIPYWMEDLIQEEKEDIPIPGIWY